jgi:hypothetical protein
MAPFISSHIMDLICFDSPQYHAILCKPDHLQHDHLHLDHPKCDHLKRD